MSRLSPLMIQLIETHPLTAAKTLSEMNSSDVADFFELMPIQQATSLISRISAWSASTLIVEMNAVSSAAILSELDYQTAVSIVRIIPDANRAQLLEALPRKLRNDLIATLSYPTNTVGAKMSTGIAVMTEDQTVGDAFLQLRQIKRTRTGVAFVVNDSRKLLGLVNADEILQKPNEVKLKEVMDRSVKPLSARASLSTVKSLSAWDDYAHLPVVDRQKILIGALARRAFRQVVVDKPVVSSQTPSMLASVAGAFFHSSIALAFAWVDAEQPTEPTLKEPTQSRREDRL